MAVEMVYRTSDGKCYNTIEEAEQAESNIIKIKRMKDYFGMLFDQYKIYDDDNRTWILYSLDDIAVHLVNNFEDVKELMGEHDN